jgi:hypothetical protein
VWSAHVQQRQRGGDDDDDAIRLWDVGIYEGTYVPILQYGEIIREERGEPPHTAYTLRTIHSYSAIQMAIAIPGIKYVWAS